MSTLQEIYGNFLHFCQILITFGNCYQLLPSFATIATFANFCQLWPTFANFCQLLSIFDNFYQLFPIFDNFYQLLTTFTNFWYFLPTFGLLLPIFCKYYHHIILLYCYPTILSSCHLPTCHLVILSSCQSGSFSILQIVDLSVCELVSLSACQLFSLSAFQLFSLSALQLAHLGACELVLYKMPCIESTEQGASQTRFWLCLIITHPYHDGNGETWWLFTTLTVSNHFEILNAKRKQICKQTGFPL